MNTQLNAQWPVPWVPHRHPDSHLSIGPVTCGLNLHCPIPLYPELADNHVVDTARGVGPGVCLLMSEIRQRTEIPRDPRSQAPDRITP